MTTCICGRPRQPDGTGCSGKRTGRKTLRVRECDLARSA